MKQPNFAAMSPVVAKAIEQMMAEQGDKFSLEKVNLAEPKRRTGISRARLRRMKEHGFEDTEHAAKGRKASTTLLSGYTGILDGLLKNGVTNSAVCLSRLRANGYSNMVFTSNRDPAQWKENFCENDEMCIRDRPTHWWNPENSWRQSISVTGLALSGSLKPSRSSI